MRLYKFINECAIFDRNEGLFICCGPDLNSDFAFTHVLNSTVVDLAWVTGSKLWPVFLLLSYDLSCEPCFGFSWFIWRSSKTEKHLGYIPLMLSDSLISLIKWSLGGDLFHLLFSCLKMVLLLAKKATNLIVSISYLASGFICIAKCVMLTLLPVCGRYQLKPKQLSRNKQNIQDANRYNFKSPWIISCLLGVTISRNPNCNQQQYKIGETHLNIIESYKTYINA